MDFPFTYHNDEPSKVEQVMTGTRNLRHPVLMLTVADGVVGWFGVREKPQRVAWVGRAMSGLAMAVAVGALGATVTLAVGWLPGLFAGVLGLARADFFEASQMFKEDAWHLATGALAVLGAVAWVRQPEARRSIGWAWGFGCVLGLAVSARYYAVLPAGLALVWVWMRGDRWWQGLGVAALGLVGVFLILHLSWLKEVEWVRREVTQEMAYFLHGHFGVGEAVPHRLYWRKWETMASLFQWVLVSVGLLGLVTRRHWAGLVALGGVAVYVAVLSWSPKFSDRYFLPVEWAWCLALGLGLGVAGMALLRFGRAFGETWGVALATLGVGGAGLWLVAGPWAEMEERQARFDMDTRQELARWIETHLPPEARWVEDDLAQIRVWLPHQTLSFAEFVVDLGTPEDFIAAGATHVVLCRDRHHRYSARGQVIRVDEGGAARVRRERYQRLLEEGRLVWSRPGMNPKVLHPGLDLIELAPFRSGAGAEGKGRGEKDQGQKE